MRLALPLLLLVLLVVSLLFWLRGAAMVGAVEPPEAAVVETVSGGEVEREPDLSVRVTAAVEPSGPQPTEDAEPDAPVSEQEQAIPTGVGDLEAKVPITIRVLDDTDTPVAEASVAIWGMRREDRLGSHYLYRGDQPIGETDTEGRVELEHWEWVTVDGRTGKVTLRITHPDFVTFTEDVAIGPGERVVHLERGATVVVTGWFGSTTNVIRDLTLQVDRESRLAPASWSRLADGRLATTRIPSGPHWIVATHEHAELGRLSSAPEHFEVGEIGWETLHLELHAPIDFIGRLDTSVPRPVVDGHVMLVLRSGGLSSEPVLYQMFETEIEPDGSFVLPGLRPGEGQIFALCQGWSSAETLVEDPIQAGIHLGPDATAEAKQRALEQAGRRAYLMQRAEVPQVDTPCVLQMERTGTLEVSVVGPSGAPVEGATVSAWPNVQVIGVGSWIHPWRDWSARTGLDGLARIEDLPPNDWLAFSVSAEGLRMSAEDRNQSPAGKIPSGGSATAEIRLELAGG